MARRVLDKYKQVTEAEMIWEHTDPDLKSRLQPLLTGASRVVLELACGSGDYTLALAANESTTLHIGIDIQGERLLKGAKLAKEQGLENVLFMRIFIEQILEYFPKNSIAEIWITFPDPYPRDKHIKRRLTNLNFLNIYQRLLIKDGVVNFKTDDPDLFAYSVEQISLIKTKNLEIFTDIYGEKINYPDAYIQTYYETQHLLKGRKINYLRYNYVETNTV